MDAGGNIVKKAKEENEVHNAFFASVFNSKTACSQDTQPAELEDRHREQTEPHILQEEMISDLLHHLNV